MTPPEPLLLHEFNSWFFQFHFGSVSESCSTFLVSPELTGFWSWFVYPAWRTSGTRSFRARQVSRRPAAFWQLPCLAASTRISLHPFSNPSLVAPANVYATVRRIPIGLCSLQRPSTQPDRAPRRRRMLTFLRDPKEWMACWRKTAGCDRRFLVSAEV